jgi:nitroreductase
MSDLQWDTFSAINEHRRSVRDFTGEPLSDKDMRAILEATQLAPSSSNLQPDELHWVKDPGLCSRMAEACKGQRSAKSASAFVVIVAKWRGVKQTYQDFLAHVDHSALYDEKSKAYHHGRSKEISLISNPVARLLAGGFRFLLSFFTAHVTLAPFGTSGLHHWAARNSIFAAQALLLAASARGLDACPMEGFNPMRVAKVLGLGRGEVIPVVIAIGKRREDAKIEARWRRGDAIVFHQFL